MNVIVQIVVRTSSIPVVSLFWFGVDSVVIRQASYASSQGVSCPSNSPLPARITSSRSYNHTCFPDIGQLEGWDTGQYSRKIVDGAGTHGFKETALWLRQHGIETLEWPPSSPDLNPDEYIWKCCKQKIQTYKRMNLTSEDMWPAAVYEWNKLVEREAYMKWVRSMPERCRDVIKNRGVSAKW